MTWEGLTPPYSTIVADPPWEYGNANKKGSAFMKDRGWRSVQQLGYSPMPLDEIAALDVESLAADDAHLYLWTTNAFLYAAHDVTRSWGFTPKTVLTWTKTHQDDPARVSMKTGYYFRGATEHVIFAVRGSLRLQTRDGLPTGYLWPRIGAHSRKPAAFYDLVEKASPAPRVELFSRAPALGWDSWGFGFEGAAALAGPVTDTP